MTDPKALADKILSYSPIYHSYEIELAREVLSLTAKLEAEREGYRLNLLQWMREFGEAQSALDAAKAEAAVLLKAAQDVRAARLSGRDSIHDEIEALVRAIKIAPLAAQFLATHRELQDRVEKATDRVLNQTTVENIVHMVLAGIVSAQTEKEVVDTLMATNEKSLYAIRAVEGE